MISEDRHAINTCSNRKNGIMLMKISIMCICVPNLNKRYSYMSNILPENFNWIHLTVLEVFNRYISIKYICVASLYMYNLENENQINAYLIILSPSGVSIIFLLSCKYLLYWLHKDNQINQSHVQSIPNMAWCIYPTFQCIVTSFYWLV